MPTLQLKTRDQLLAEQMNETVAKSDLSDMIDTSGVKHVLGASSTVLAGYYGALAVLRQQFGFRGTGLDLDERGGDFPSFFEPRRAARRAVGRVQFSRLTADAAVLTIAAGYVIKARNGRTYVTIQTATIPSLGTVSNQVSAICTSVGASGNVAVGEVIGFSGAPPPGVAAVVNTTRMAYGRDREGDEELATRMKTFCEQLASTPVEALRQLLLGVVDETTGQSVVHVNAFEDPEQPGYLTFYIDDGVGTAGLGATEYLGVAILTGAAGTEQYVRALYYPLLDNSPLDFVLTRTRAAVDVELVRSTDYFLNPATGLIKLAPGVLAAGDDLTADLTQYGGLIATAQKFIDGLRGDRIAFPGKRGMGTRVRALPATPLVITVRGSCQLTRDGTPADISTAQSDVIDYINGLRQDADDGILYVVRNEIIERIMSVDGIFNVQLDEPAAETTPVTPDFVTLATAASVELD